MDIGTISLFFTIVVFGAVGWLIAGRRKKPAGPLTFVVLLAVAVVGYYVGVGTRLVDVDGFKVLLNWAIVSGCVGGCLGLLVRNRRLRRLENA
ncbi:MAG: hypothetical protein ABFR33_05190 [Verrucomicrobiota bacterium]